MLPVWAPHFEKRGFGGIWECRTRVRVREGARLKVGLGILCVQQLGGYSERWHGHVLGTEMQGCGGRGNGKEKRL